MTERRMRSEAPATAKREAQFMGQDESIVYEAIATRRQPMTVVDLVAMTGLDEETVKAALARLTDLEMIRNDGDKVGLGDNDWELRGR